MTDVARAAVLTEFGKPLEIWKFSILGPEPAPGESVTCQLRISAGARPGANISRPRVSPRARARRTAA